ncbi:hypothetical protein T492DRAFT_1132784 [Pavlovales sp. CCMP2436]|nr:hypothetical protein T492DRAFT_1132784 [Pavlovales sp. CCMP2436]
MCELRAATQNSKQRRFVCLVGDGAFQMTAQEAQLFAIQTYSNVLAFSVCALQELSTAVRDNLPVTGYGIERLIHNGPRGNDYNDIHDWKYAEFAKSFRLGEDGRPGVSLVVSSEAQMLQNKRIYYELLLFIVMSLYYTVAWAFQAVDSKDNMGVCNFIEVQINNDDFSDALRRVGDSLRKTNKLPDNPRSELESRKPAESLVAKGAL